MSFWVMMRRSLATTPCNAATCIHVLKRYFELRRSPAMMTSFIKRQARRKESKFSRVLFGTLTTRLWYPTRLSLVFFEKVDFPLCVGYDLDAPLRAAEYDISPCPPPPPFPLFSPISYPKNPNIRV